MVKRTLWWVMVVAGAGIILFDWPTHFWEPNIVEVLTIVFVVAAVILAGGRKFWDHYLRPNHVYDLRFFPTPSQWPPAPVQGEYRKKSLVIHADIGVISMMAGIQAKEGGSISSVEIRFVNRKCSIAHWRPWCPFALWRWKPVPLEILDVKELQESERFYTYAPSPNGIGGMRLRYYERPRWLTQGDWLWLSTQVSVSQTWEGYLEFLAPIPDGRRGYCRRPVMFVIRAPGGK